MSVRPPRRSRALLLVSIGGCLLGGAALIALTVRSAISDELAIVLVICVAVALKLIVSRTQMNDPLAGSTWRRDKKSLITNTARAFASFVTMGGWAWFGAKMMPDTNTGAVMLYVPILVFLGLGVFFSAKTLSALRGNDYTNG